MSESDIVNGFCVLLLAYIGVSVVLVHYFFTTSDRQPLPGMLIAMISVFLTMAAFAYSYERRPPLWYVLPLVSLALTVAFVCWGRRMASHRSDITMDNQRAEASCLSLSQVRRYVSANGGVFHALKFDRLFRESATLEAYETNAEALIRRTEVDAAAVPMRRGQDLHEA